LLKVAERMAIRRGVHRNVLELVLQCPRATVRWPSTSWLNLFSSSARAQPPKSISNQATSAEVRLVGELLDGDAAVTKHPLFTVVKVIALRQTPVLPNEGSKVIQPALVAQLRNVHGPLAFGARQDRQLILFVTTVKIAFSGMFNPLGLGLQMAPLATGIITGRVGP